MMKKKDKFVINADFNSGNIFLKNICKFHFIQIASLSWNTWNYVGGIFLFNSYGKKVEDENKTAKR